MILRCVFIALLLLPRIVHGQADYSRLFEQQTVPVPSLDEYPEATFEWTIPGSSQIFMNGGLTDIYEKNYSGAIENLKEVIKLHPDFWPAYYYLGIAHILLYEFAEAEKNLGESIKLNPKLWQARLQLGKIHLAKSRITKALTEIERAQDLNPSSEVTTYNLAFAEFLNQNTRRASKLFEKCAELDPRSARSMVMLGLIKGNRKDSVSLRYFNRALEMDSLNKEALFWHGLFHYYKGDKNKTLSDWNKLVEYNADNPLYLLMRSYLNMELKQYDLAFNDLRKVMLSREDLEEAFKGGQTNMDKQVDIQSAARYAVRFSYGLKPESMASLQKGFCLLVGEDYHGALVELKKGEAIEPSSVFDFLLAITYEHSGKHNVALQHYEKALEKDKDLFDAYKKRAIYRSELKDLKGSSYDFAQMIRLQPDTKITYRLRGLTRISFKDYYGAILDLTTYLKYDSTDSDILFNRGYCQQQVGSYAASANDYFQALKYNKLNMDLFRLTVNSYMQAGDTSATMAVGTFLFESDPKNLVYELNYIYVLILNKKLDDAERRLKGLNTENYGVYGIESNLNFVRASLLYSRGQLDKARKLFLRTLTQDDRNQEARYMLARCYLKLNERDKALSELTILARNSYKDSKGLIASLNGN